MTNQSEAPTPIARLTRDLAAAGKLLSTQEARFLVDAYYTIQADRMRANAQMRALKESGEPNKLLEWLAEQNETLEKQIQRALDKYSAAHPVGAWMRSICGIGPVIAAGFLAYIDITRCPTAGHIWSYAGLNPDQKWEKGQKRPFNAALKVLCYKLGESFVKVQSSDNDTYGKMFKARKELEIQKNESGDYQVKAAEALARFHYGKDTEAYKAYSAGKLPPAHIHARARRWAVKIFLSHLHQVWYEFQFNKPAPKPYVVEHMGHVHIVPPPNWASMRG